MKLQTSSQLLSMKPATQTLLKVRGPFVETQRIFLSMQNINYAEILA